MAKSIAALRIAGAVHGWSMGFEKFKTVTTAGEWERKFIVRGLIAGVCAAVWVAAYSWAVAALGFPSAFLAIGVGCACAIVGMYFYQFLNKDIEE